MQNKPYTSAAGYLLSISAILAWWYFAFLFPLTFHHTGLPEAKDPPSSKEPPPKFLSYLSPLKREKIQEALAGNVKTMTSLISDWDVDARILEKQGLFNVRRLSREKFLKAQMIGRELANSSDDELRALREKLSEKAIEDDMGNRFNLPLPYQKFLPQTYFAASVLLAISPPESIVAIPQGLRLQQELYPPTITERIPLDIDRYHSEEIYRQKPDVAFVAHYSHPSTLQALQAQGIPLFTIKSIDTIPQITSTINKIGQMANRPLEAELLTLFMESALLAIDNHLLAMSQSVIEELGSPRVMFLSHLTQFSIPTSNTITGKLIEQLESCHFNFITLHAKEREKWMIPVSQEQILELNPDCLIVAACDKKNMRLNLMENPALQSISAIQNNKVFVIDAAPQAPTQYVVLAYFDLADALIQATSPYAR